MALRITVNNSGNAAEITSCERLENALASSKGISTDDAQRAICALCQAGGTNNAQGTLSVTLEDSTATPAVKLKITLKEIKDLIKSNKINITMRQYARARALQCHDVGVEFEIPGDLYKKLTHMFGPISREDSYWCSSFQMDTDVCPSNVKDLLVKHYNSIFRKV